MAEHATRTLRPEDEIAHYRIVGKAADVVPMMIKALRERSADEAASWGAADAAPADATAAAVAAEPAGAPAAEGAAQ